MAAPTTLICVFVTRGHSGVEGQGDELLWLTPARLRRKGVQLFEFVLVDKLEGPTAKSKAKDGKIVDPALRAASRMISANCFLDADKDLR